MTKVDVAGSVQAVNSLLHNDIIWAAGVAWFVAQALKVMIALITERKLNFRRFVGTGGMPSAHSAFVSALAAAVGIKTGWNSTISAVALVLALVVMYDAAGVRYAAGKQAEVLNRIIDDLYRGGAVQQGRLKELLGHTPKEVIVGAGLGIIIARMVLWKL